MPKKILQIDFTENICPVKVDTGYNAYYILVRYQKQLIGWILIPVNTGDEYISTETLTQAIKRQLGREIIQQELGQRIGCRSYNIRSTQGISVIVCTRNRPHYLSFCLDALIQLEYPEYEIIIVDNAPNSEDAYTLTSKYPVRYVREERPGLDWARNRGIAEAKYDIVAFTDDDAKVDSWWLHAIGKAFINEQVMGVTGYVAPAELETSAQEIFEFKYGGMGHGLTRKVFDCKNLTNRQLMWASSFGVGANMAFRRNVFNKIGLFDIALDVGTPSRGAGDVEMFYRLVRSGYLLAYEPGMLVWHVHRKNKTDLRRQIFDNGCSFGCYIIKCFIEGHISRSAIAKFFFIDWFCNWNLRNLIRAPRNLPRTLSLAELIGMLKSPFAYRATKKWAKQIMAKERVFIKLKQQIA